MAVGLEPTMTGLTIRRLTNLATPQNISDLRSKISDCLLHLHTAPAYCLLMMEAMKGLEPLSTGLQDRRLIQLSYIAEVVFGLRALAFVRTSGPNTKDQRPSFGGLGGSQTLTKSLQDFYAVSYITSPSYCQFSIVDCRFITL